tara:strand:- start:3467 stop:3814 length:348 start_codon:yes stop_codon:yes gene_type:complete
MKKYEEKIWNEMITGPSYFDDDEETKFEPAECLIEHENWVICMEGRRVYWKFNDFMMGAFTFKPKTWTDKGNEFPQFWPQWLIFRFIGHVWGYHEDNKKDLKPLVEWATDANNRQ